MTSTLTNNKVILSRSILFRHGSRGPGESELSIWEKDHPVATQWKEEEIENLSNIGRSQMSSLGTWFCSRCDDLGEKSKVIQFNTSKSSRAIESGNLFVSSYSKTKLATASVATNVSNSTYSIDADYYFRPWKVYTEIEKRSKENMNTSSIWQDQVDLNHDLLMDVHQDLELKSSLLATPHRLLWSLTYITNVLVCEEFWPTSTTPSDQRKSLHNLMSRLHESKQKIMSLACFVWDIRFVTSGYQIDLGGWLFLDMIQKLFGYEDCGQSIQLFSGHDYTIISVLAAAGLLTSLVTPIEWGAYIIMELYNAVTGTVESPETQNLELRIYHNRQPFGASKDNIIDDTNTSTVNDSQDDLITVHHKREVLLTVLDMPQLNTLLENICSVLRDHGRDLPPNFLIPCAISS